MKFITVHDIFLRKQIWTAGRPVEFTHADYTLVIESGLALSWECSWDKYHFTSNTTICSCDTDNKYQPNAKYHT